MNNNNVISEVADLVSRENVISGEKLNDFAIDGRIPFAAVTPESTNEIIQVVLYAKEKKLSLAPIGGGTCLYIGNLLKGFDLALITSRLNRVIEFNPDDLTVTVEAGMKLKTLQEILYKKNRFVPFDPPLSGRATVGGIIATNASGPQRFKFGTPRNIIIGINAVLANGTSIKAGGRVVKNVAGYDISKLISGSFGTLGIITALSLKLYPFPQRKATFKTAFRSIEPLFNFCLSRQIAVLDPWAMDFAYNISDSENRDFTLMFEFSGPESIVEKKIDESRKMSTEFGSTNPEVMDSNDFWEKIRDFGRNDRKIILKISVLPSQTVLLLKNLFEKIRDKDKISIIGRAGNGIVYSFFDNRELINCHKEVVKRLNGRMIIEKCPVAVKENLDVFGKPGKDIRIMEDIKTKFDPAGTLNPGRFMGKY